jgi:hypothetical protein
VKKIILGVGIAAAVLAGVMLRSRLWGKLAVGSLQVSASPKAKVLIDGVERGMTPFLDDGVGQGEHELKLVVEGGQEMSWEGRIEVNAGARTVVNRNISVAGENYDSGEVLTLEKTATKDKAALAVVSIPDQAVVKIEGQPKGFAPINLTEVIPGDYEVSVALPGYEEKVILARMVAGYKLVMRVQLAQKTEGIQAGPVAPMGTPTSGPTRELTPTPSGESLGARMEKPYVTIKETPTGFLRVRETAGGKEVAQVKPKESFPLVGRDDKGWYKIEYEKGRQGWISSVYAEVSE